jgi:hypothetical protein
MEFWNMNNGPMKSPQEAAQQIRQLLSSYIHKHQELKTSAWLPQANAGLTAFNAAFPENVTEGAKPLNLDDLKDHVLNNLAPKFVIMVKWILLQHGSSSLRADLEKAANSWPKHQEYLVYAAEQKAAKALEEKATVEKEKQKLTEEKEAVDAQRQRLVEEKARAAADAESIRNALIEEQKSLVAQLQALKLENQTKTELVTGLKEVNKELILRAKPLVPSFLEVAKAADAAQSKEAKQQDAAPKQNANTQKKVVSKR